MTILERARRYIGSLPPAVAGAGGHAATFAAAVALVRGFNLPDHVALDELRLWNMTHADPPWNDADLRHKIRSAAQSDKPAGYLLSGAYAAPGSTSLSDDEVRRKAEARKSWPVFRPLSDTTLAEIAALRRLPVEAVAIANNAGLLAGAMIDGYRCFLIHEGTFAQARRLDGGTLSVASGESKAKNLFGSQGVYIGCALLGAGPVLLVEGCVGLLEGIAAALIVDADAQGWTVVAATSASSRFTGTPWLARLRNRRVRILPDRDIAGLRAAGIWTAELSVVGAVVDAVTLPADHKDLGDIVADPAKYRETLETIFHL